MTIPAHISFLLRAHTCEVIRQIPDLKDRDDRFPTDLACVVLVAGQRNRAKRERHGSKLAISRTGTSRSGRNATALFQVTCKFSETFCSMLIDPAKVCQLYSMRIIYLEGKGHNWKSIMLLVFGIRASGLSPMQSTGFVPVS